MNKAIPTANRPPNVRASVALKEAAELRVPLFSELLEVELLLELSLGLLPELLLELLPELLPEAPPSEAEASPDVPLVGGVPGARLAVWVLARAW